MPNHKKDKNPSQNKSYANSGLLESVKKMYLNTKTSDIKFLFGSIDGTVKRVAAHKCVLAATSDVFEAMFYGDMKETGDVQITDSSESAFMEFLQFFYLGQVELTAENLVGVTYLGHKYQVTNCINACFEFLRDNLTVENVGIVIDLAFLYGHQELLEICEKVIISDTAGAFESDGFLKCSKATLDHILEMDVLSCSEVRVFEACMAWVEIKSGQEVLSRESVATHLDESFYEIRFASMTMQQLCTLHTAYETAFSSDDFVAAAKIISTPGSQQSKFNTSLRRAKWNDDAVIKCDRRHRDIDHLPIVLLNNEKTFFSTNKSLILGSFTCEKIVIGDAYSVSDLEGGFPVGIRIIEATDFKGSSAKVLSTSQTQLSSTSTNVKLPQPILIRRGLFYTIAIGPFPEGYRYYSSNLKWKVELESDITVEFRNSIGLIPTLNFNRI